MSPIGGRDRYGCKLDSDKDEDLAMVCALKLNPSSSSCMLLKPEFEVKGFLSTVQPWSTDVLPCDVQCQYLHN